MKLKTVLLLSIFLMSMGAIAQPLHVENNIDVDYMIEVSYWGGTTGSFLVEKCSSGNNIIDIDYEDPNNPGNVINTWKIYALDCPPVLIPEQNYDISSVKLVTACDACKTKGEATYDAQTQELHINCLPI